MNIPIIVNKSAFIFVENLLNSELDTKIKAGVRDGVHFVDPKDEDAERELLAMCRRILGYIRDGGNIGIPIEHLICIGYVQALHDSGLLTFPANQEYKPIPDTVNNFGEKPIVLKGEQTVGELLEALHKAAAELNDKAAAELNNQTKGQKRG